MLLQSSATNERGFIVRLIKTSGWQLGVSVSVSVGLCLLGGASVCMCVSFCLFLFQSASRLCATLSVSVHVYLSVLSNRVPVCLDVCAPVLRYV